MKFTGKRFLFFKSILRVLQFPCLESSLTVQRSHPQALLNQSIQYNYVRNSGISKDLLSVLINIVSLMIFPVGVKNMWYIEYIDLFMTKQFLTTLFSVAET